MLCSWSHDAILHYRALIIPAYKEYNYISKATITQCHTNRIWVLWDHYSSETNHISPNTSSYQLAAKAILSSITTRWEPHQSSAGPRFSCASHVHSRSVSRREGFREMKEPARHGERGVGKPFILLRNEGMAAGSVLAERWMPQSCLGSDAKCGMETIKRSRLADGVPGFKKWTCLIFAFVKNINNINSSWIEVRVCKHASDFSTSYSCSQNCLKRHK